MEILQITGDKPEFSNFIGDTLILKEKSKVCLNKASFSIPVIVNRNVVLPSTSAGLPDYTKTFFNVVLNEKTAAILDLDYKNPYVELIEIKKNRLYFTCSSINQSDFQELDYIKVINNNTFTLSQMFQKPFKIKRIQKNVIICDYPGTDQLENNIYTDIDMKLMNMSNQNIIFFN